MCDTPKRPTRRAFTFETNGKRGRAPSVLLALPAYEKSTP